MRRFTALIWLFTGLVAAYVLVSVIITRQNTGLLTVTTQNRTTSISLSQLKSQAHIVGVGGAKVRLYPGTYQVSANNGTKQAAALVTISKQTSAKVILNPTKSSKLPSVEDISFDGTDGLTNVGMTSGQLQSLKDDFFKFNSSASKVNIDIGSISQGARSRSAPTAMFSMTFKVTVDSTQYSAKATYSFADPVELVLYDSQSNQVFDSGPIPTT